MSLLLSLNKDKSRFRFYSTMVDKYLSDWLTRDEALEFIRNRKQNRLEAEMKEETEFFPKEWFNKEEKRYIGLNQELEKDTN